MWKNVMDTEQVKAATTPEEMRAELFRLQHYDYLVRVVMDSANYRGASAEDRYTELAYHAIKQLAQLKQHVLNDVRCSVAPKIVITGDGEERLV